MASTVCSDVPALGLPFELQKRIASRCHKPDMASLARIHSFWTAACEEALYERVTLDKSASANAFLETIASNSRKAALVRALEKYDHQDITPEGSRLFYNAVEHLHHLRFLNLSLLTRKYSNRLATLMRGGGLNTLHALRMYDWVVGDGSTHNDAFLDLQAAVLSLAATLRVVALSNHGYLRESVLAPFAAIYSVMVEWESEDLITLYPQLYCGPRRATYLDDCVWAVNSALFYRDFSVASLEIRTDNLATVGDVIHAMAGDLPALKSLYLSFAAPGNCKLLDAGRVAAALRPVAAGLCNLGLHRDEHRSVQIALPDIEFAKQLVDAGCTDLHFLYPPGGKLWIRSDLGHWYTDYSD